MAYHHFFKIQGKKDQYSYNTQKNDGSTKEKLLLWVPIVLLDGVRYKICP